MNSQDSNPDILTSESSLFPLTHHLPAPSYDPQGVKMPCNIESLCPHLFHSKKWNSRYKKRKWLAQDASSESVLFLSVILGAVHTSTALKHLQLHRNSDLSQVPSFWFSCVKPIFFWGWCSSPNSDLTYAIPSCAQQLTSFHATVKPTKPSVASGQNQGLVLILEFLWHALIQPVPWPLLTRFRCVRFVTLMASLVRHPTQPLWEQY